MTMNIEGSELIFIRRTSGMSIFNINIYLNIKLTYKIIQISFNYYCNIYLECSFLHKKVVPGSLCEKAYVCIDVYNLYLFRCPNGLLFDISFQRCNYSNQVICPEVESK